MLYPVELPVHSEEVETVSLAINQVNGFEAGEGIGAELVRDRWRIGLWFDRPSGPVSSILYLVCTEKEIL